MFHLVSLSLQISLTNLPGPCLGLCVGVVFLVVFLVVFGGFFVGFFPLGKFDLNHMLIPVVDRPCLALVRQCRKKNPGCLLVLFVLCFGFALVFGFVVWVCFGGHLAFCSHLFSNT